jgi:oxygen-independent coproporphyrinogen-3 oxidase
VGPGAHSFNGSTRYLNVRNNYKYIQTINRNKLPNTEEVLTPQDLANEYLMTSLRTFAGCNLEKLHKKYGYDLIGHSKENLVKWEKAGFLTIVQDQVQLTTRGKLLADEITADLYWA